jgi:hypothetical protein
LEVVVMVVIDPVHVDADVDADPDVDRGGWLVAHRWEMDRGESTWLDALATFDRDQGWAADGQLSCAEWLMWRTAMSRATAFEKLRIARQLQSRPVVADAFADGRLSYSAVRAITRMEDPDPEVDAALVEVAVAGTVADVERAVRCYQLHADQHRAPSAEDRRNVRMVRGFDGTGRIEITVSDVELEEFASVLRAFVDVGDRPRTSSTSQGEDEAMGESPRGDCSTGDADQSSRGDSPAGRTPHLWRSGQADAFMDMVRVALAHVDDGHAVEPTVTWSMWWLATRRRNSSMAPLSIRPRRRRLAVTLRPWSTSSVRRVNRWHWAARAECGPRRSGAL